MRFLWNSSILKLQQLGRQEILRILAIDLKLLAGRSKRSETFQCNKSLPECIVTLKCQPFRWILFFEASWIFVKSERNAVQLLTDFHIKIFTSGRREDKCLNAYVLDLLKYLSTLTETNDWQSHWLKSIWLSHFG